MSAPNQTTKQAEPVPAKATPPSLPVVPAKTVATTEQPNATQAPHEEKGYWTSEWWLVYLTGALVLVTGALALYTAKLFRATVKLGADAKATSDRQANETAQALELSRVAGQAAIKSAEVAEKSLKMAERGYVGLSSWKLENMTTADDHALFTFTTKNIGNTPVTITAMLHAISVRDKLPEKVKYDGTPDRSSLPLGPSQDCANPVRVPINNKPGFENVLSGKVTLWFYGYVEYLDVFGESHRSGYCLKYLPKDGSLRIAGPDGYNYAN